MATTQLNALGVRAMTDVDRELIYDLTHRVRLATESQVARMRSRTLVRTRREIQKLVRAGWLRTKRLLITKPSPLIGPIATWNAGQRRPDFGSISHQLMSRATRESGETTIVHATRKAANAFCGWTNECSRPLQASHDAGLVEALIAIRSHDPVRGATWQAEDLLKRTGEMRGFVPDAVTITDVVMVVDFCSASYSPDRWRRLHRSCERSNFAYELW